MFFIISKIIPTEVQLWQLEMHLNELLLVFVFFFVTLSDQCHPPRITQHITLPIGSHWHFWNGDLITTKWCYAIPSFCLESNGTWTAWPNSENDIGDYVLNYRPRPHNTSSGIMLHVVKNDTTWMARPELHKGYSKTQIDLASIHRRIMASIPDEAEFLAKKETTTKSAPTTWLPIVFPPTESGNASPRLDDVDSLADGYKVNLPTNMETSTTGPSWHPIVFPPSVVAASPSKDIADPSASEFNIKADEETTRQTTARTSTAYMPIVFPPKTSEIAAIPVRSSEVEMTVQEPDRIWNILMVGVILAFILISALMLGAFFYCH
ncbi:hypothetical protein B9Z55_026529 [Caenorhabditis nigoni]|uniref:Uncharacterized protein n=1 Tax=Caenorhabditis nigoni TaxID=1611254 RepID=A0A2G5T440_9PELO|nr:hypothetical protein B9Z55_026529 [Caenorhabditis nigoni]